MDLGFIIHRIQVSVSLQEYKSLLQFVIGQSKVKPGEVKWREVVLT